MKKLSLILLLISLPVMAQQYTTVTVEGIDKPILVNITGMQVTIPVQCEEKFCDSADTDCDGTLDEVCPGLTYNVCKDGSIVDAYMDAALTGFCIQEPEPEGCREYGELVFSPDNRPLCPLDPDSCNQLVISPATGDPRCADL